VIRGDVISGKKQQLQRMLLPACMLAAVYVLPNIISNPYHLSVIIMIGLYSIIVIGLNLVLGNTGQISLGQSGFFGIGAYASAVYCVDVGVNAWIAMLLAGLTAALFGYAVGFASVRLRGHYLAMATLGFAVIVTIVLMEWTAVTGGAGGFPDIIPYPRIGSFVFNTDGKFYYLVSTVVIIIYFCSKNISSYRIGRALYAVNQHETAAEVLGVNPGKYKLKIFTLSAFYAGIAGSLFAHYSTYIAPESFSFYLNIPLLCMVVVGGLASVKGSIIGTAVLVLLPEVIRFLSKLDRLPKALQHAFGDYTYHLLAYGVLLMIFVVFIPKGIAGLLTKIRENVNARRQQTRR
jgi:branched-chain amino acid transport system permease protein